MDQNELAKFRATSEIARNYRRQNERLREALGIYTDSQRKFDDENAVFFAFVHENHRRKKDYANF